MTCFDDLGHIHKLVIQQKPDIFNSNPFPILFIEKEVMRPPLRFWTNFQYFNIPFQIGKIFIQIWKGVLIVCSSVLALRDFSVHLLAPTFSPISSASLRSPTFLYWLFHYLIPMLLWDGILPYVWWPSLMSCRIPSCARPSTSAWFHHSFFRLIPHSYRVLYALASFSLWQRSYDSWCFHRPFLITFRPHVLVHNLRPMVGTCFGAQFSSPQRFPSWSLERLRFQYPL